MGEYQGILFDMDGVLVDSEPLFLRAINRIVAETGNNPVSEDENEEFLLGTTVEGTWEELKKIRRLPDSIESYIERYDAVVREVLFHDLVPQPGVKRLVEECERRGLPKAVASSSRRDWVELKLEAIGLQGRFNAVLGGNDVVNGKPDPEIYLKAAESLGLAAESCIAIEDSPIGIEAAASSGAFTIAVRTYFTRNLDISRANLIVDSLEEFDYSLLAGE